MIHMIANNIISNKILHLSRQLKLAEAEGIKQLISSEELIELEEAKKVNCYRRGK